MEEKVLVILYKRCLVDEDQDTDFNHDVINRINILNTESNEDIKDYYLSPIQVVEGIIDDDTFLSSDGKYKLKMINAIDGLKDEFVYAFPIDVSDYDKKSIKETAEYIKEEELYNSYLLQSFDSNVDKSPNTYVFNAYSDRVLTLVDPYSYDNTLSTMIYDASELVSQLKEKNILLLRPSDVEHLKKIEEEKKQTETKYETSPHKAIKYLDNYIYSNELYDEITKYVIKQDEQIRRVATIFAKNQRIDNPRLKSNFILCGPTGVGKTEIFRQISRIVDIPMIEEDSAEFTAAGYVGRTVTEMLVNLYNAADGDLKKAENGIIYMDEIDKKANTNKDMEVNRGAVIQALLKMIEGHIYPINVGKKQIYFDTSRVTFAFSGAFSDIEKFSKDYCEKQLGFGNTQLVTKLDKTKIYNTQTLKNYGLMPEFIGRNKIIVMNDLDNVEDLETILTTSNLSYLKLYSEYLKSLSIAFEYDNDVIRAIAERALLEKTGARSLSSITESALEVADYYITSKNASKYKLLKITPKTIEDNTNFILR